MARPLLERLALDLKPTGRIADCKRDLAEAEAERAQIDQRIAECERRSEDPATAEDDAHLAHRQAADWRFHAKRLDHAIAAVRESIAAKEVDQSRLERRKQFDAAKAARDALAERWRALAPVWDDLMTLLADTVENNALLTTANRQRPGGEVALRSAEAEGRGALTDGRWPNSIGYPGEPFERFVAMDWPKFTGPGLAFSLREAERREIVAQVDRGEARVVAAAAAEEEANKPEAIAARAAARAARYSSYMVSQRRYSGTMLKGVCHRDGVSGVDSEPVPLWMDADQARAAERLGLKLERAQFKEAAVLGTLSRPRGVLQLSSQT